VIERWSGWVGLWLLAAGPVGAEPFNLDKAVAQVQREIDGRVLGAREVVEEGRPVYVIRVLTPDGRVVHMRVDQETGRILRPPVRQR
jgi:uncharacterized membrane protein YkoI